MAKKFRYTHDVEWTLERGEDSIDVLVEYDIEEEECAPSGMFGPPENYDPGSGWAFCINNEASSDAGIITLTEQEIDAIHDWLCENPPVDDGYYDD